MLLYPNDVNVYSGLVSLYMRFVIHSNETSLSTLRLQACDLVSALPFKASPRLPLDHIKTLYSVA